MYLKRLLFIYIIYFSHSSYANLDDNKIGTSVGNELSIDVPISTPDAIETEPTENPILITEDQQSETADDILPLFDPDFDWIKLTSGEWLKGDIDVFYNNVLDFDSDKLGMEKIDWENVEQIKSSRPYIIRVLGRRPLVGTFSVNSDNLIVTTRDNKQHSFTRNSILTVATGSGNESDFWSSNITLGLNLSRGNTDEIEYNTIMNATRRSSFSRFDTNYIGAYSKANNELTANNHRIDANYDYFVRRNLYLSPFLGSFYADELQNIKYRSSLGFGFGYTLLNFEKTELNTTFGLAYQQTQYLSVLAGEDDTESTPSILVNTNLTRDLTDNLEYVGTYDLTFLNEASGSYMHHLVNTLSIDLTTILDLDLSLIWDRTARTKADADGNVPKNDDYQLFIGLGFDF